MIDNKLSNYIDEVLKVKENAYVPYSNYRVGAILVSKDGQVYSGCNIENASYGATICAERTAIAKAVSEGITQFEAIFITSDSNEFAFPCGICRQVLVEFLPNGDLYVVNQKREYKKFKISDLLPHFFSSKDMEGLDV